MLTSDQASKNLRRPAFFGGFKFSIPGIKYYLNTSDISCDEVNYLCASFGVGDAPNLDYPMQLKVYGVKSEYRKGRRPDRLVGCQQFICEGRLSLVGCRF